MYGAARSMSFTDVWIREDRTIVSAQPGLLILYWYCIIDIQILMSVWSSKEYVITDVWIREDRSIVSAHPSLNWLLMVECVMVRHKEPNVLFIFIYLWDIAHLTICLLVARKAFSIVGGKLTLNKNNKNGHFKVRAILI